MKRYFHQLQKCLSLAIISSAFNVNAQIISTIAGTGASGYSGDSGLAVSAQLHYPYAIIADQAGSLYFADWFNHCIRRIDQKGIISTVAGTGAGGYSGDNGPANIAQLNLPTGLYMDGAGNIFISDYGNSRIRKVNTNGIITTVAGTGAGGFSGDGGPATLAQFNSIINITMDAAGNIFIADMNNNRIRKIDTNGIISTVAGNGTLGYSGDGGPAISAQLRGPQGVAIDKGGNLYIADSYNHCIRKVNTNGIISTVSGNGVNGYSGDNGLAVFAQFDLPTDINVDTSGNLFIVDEFNCCVRKIGTNNIIKTIAGTGTWGVSADGGQAIQTALYYPKGVEYKGGTIYISDTQSNRIRRFSENNSAVNVDELEPGSGGLKIYPNPANTEIYIVVPGTTQYDLEIFNTLGALVLSKKNFNSGTSINVSEVNIGMYYCKLQTPQQRYIIKLIKQ